MSQQSPRKSPLNLDNDLDRSFSQQGSPNDFKRDSGIEHLNLDSDYTHEPQEHVIENKSTEFMRDSQFEEEGVFSYNDDERMRQSMKSEEDCELEDISGNSDMTDRNQNSLSLQTQSKNIAIVENYSLESDQSQPLQTEPLPQTIVHDNPIVDVIEVSTNQTVTQQPEQPLQDNIVQQSPQKLPYQQLVTPKKSPLSPDNAQQQSSKQWSNISNNSPSSPKIDPELLKSPLQSKETPKVPLAQQSSAQSKIVLVKESMVNVNSPQSKESFGSSIKDWFKTSSFTSDSTKQYNPAANQQPSPLKTQTAQEKYRRQMAAEMTGFQQTLTQHQKTNKLYGATSEQQKQKHKANKTHLAQPATKKNMQNLSQMGSDEYRMLLKISYEKKKQNYQMLKQWDKRRAQNMNLHRNVIQLLQNETDKRIKASLQNFEIYANFFKQKLKQQQKFTTSPVINTKYALQNNAISKNIYINCSVILNSLSEENHAKCKKVQDFITLIRNNVLKDLMDQHLNQSQRELLKVREKISTLKNSLKKYNTETEEKSEELAKLFGDSSSNVNMKPTSDFYSVQLQFLRSASQQILIQKRLGDNCLEYYQCALSEQLKRAKVIREALMTYSKGLMQTYSIEIEDVGLEQLSKSEQTHLISEFYCIEDMLDERCTQMLKDKFKLPNQHDLAITHVASYVEKFEFEHFNNRMLLLKEFNAKYLAAKESKQAREENCYVVITVDFCIHLFFSAQKTSLNFKPDVSLKIAPKQIDVRPLKEEFIDIVKKQEKRASMISYFWDTKNEKAYRIRLPSKDAKEEFCDYVKKLMF